MAHSYRAKRNTTNAKLANKPFDDLIAECKHIFAECKHISRIGDNYGESCQDCGKQLSGYGYGGWFGSNLTGKETCIHLWSPVGGDNQARICIYCQLYETETS